MMFTHWDWHAAPDWLKALAPLNGDDISWVRLYDRSSEFMIEAGHWSCHSVVTWHAQGLLVWRFHA